MPFLNPRGLDPQCVFTSHHHFPLVDMPGPSRKAYRLAWQYSRGDPQLQNCLCSQQVIDWKQNTFTYIYIYTHIIKTMCWYTFYLYIVISMVLFEQGLEITYMHHEPPSHMAQESCTEIINSAIADVRDAVDSFRTNSSRLCPVMSELARIRHDDSEPCP